MGKIINGKLIAEKYREVIRDFVKLRKEQQKRVPCMVTILVGDDGGSIYYVNNQIKQCEKLGVNARKIELSSNIKEEELVTILEELNNDDKVDGIIIQMPLPKHINEKNITSKISHLKDIDGLTDINAGRLFKGEKCFIPCTPKAIIETIKSTGCRIEGKHAVVIGRSNIVGKPVAQLLLNENATVTICHSRTADLKKVCQTADILIVAIGKPGFVNREYVKEGAIVIDVGTTMVEGKIKGDVLFDNVIDKASFVTPVPGGVGSVTTTMLIKNTCEAVNKDVY